MLHDVDKDDRNNTVTIPLFLMTMVLYCTDNDTLPRNGQLIKMKTSLKGKPPVHRFLVRLCCR